MEILGQNEGKETVRERNSQMPALADSCAVQPAVNGNPGSKHLTLALKKMIGWRKSLIRWGVTPEAIRMSIQRPQVPVERPLRERDLNDELRLQPTALFHLIRRKCPNRPSLLR